MIRRLTVTSPLKCSQGSPTSLINWRTKIEIYARICSITPNKKSRWLKSKKIWRKLRAKFKSSRIKSRRKCFSKSKWMMKWKQFRKTSSKRSARPAPEALSPNLCRLQSSLRFSRAGLTKQTKNLMSRLPQTK